MKDKVKSKRKKEFSFNNISDVIIIGGGAAGLSAAIEAARRNASVVLFEKASKLGGSSALAMGSVSAAGTSLQRSHHIEDSPKAHFEDLRKFRPALEHRNNVELLHLITEEAASSIEWLKDLGISFYGMSPEPPNRVPRMHNIVPGMRFCIKRLEKVAKESGVKILTNHAVLKLFQDDKNRVKGVSVKDNKNAKDPIKEYFANKAVILACGDYSNSSKFKNEFLPQGMADIEGINPLSTGDGHQLGIEAGADVVNMDLFRGAELRFVQNKKNTLKDYFKDYFPASSILSKVTAKVLDTMPKAFIKRVATEILVSWQRPSDNMFDKGAILINTSGERFVDETKSQTREIAVSAQSSKLVYLVFDANIAEQFKDWPNFISTASGIAYAYLDDYKHFRPDIIYQADTWEDLAKKISISSGSLQETIVNYNTFSASKKKDSFGRRKFGEPLAQTPFYAMGPLKPYIVTVPGGLKINKQFQVINDSGQVIPGLFAAGRNGQGGLLHFSHGLGLAWAFTSGRLAGAYAIE